MKLKDKGPLRPAPVLKGPAQSVSLELQSWADVISATHWAIGDSTTVNGSDFYVGSDELGHIHLDGEIHIPMTRRLSKALIKAKLAEPFPYGTSWIQLQISDRKTAALALWLFEIGYDLINGATEDELLERIVISTD